MTEVQCRREKKKEMEQLAQTYAGVQSHRKHLSNFIYLYSHVTFSSVLGPSDFST